MRVAIVHATMNSYKPLIDALTKSLTKDDTILHFINEYLIDRVLGVGTVDARAVQLFTELIFSAAESEPDIIVVGCSVYFPYIPSIQASVSAPIMPIDAPMLEMAVEKAKKIGLIVTTTPTIAGTEKRLLEIAGKSGKGIEVLAESVPHAFTLISQGDVKGHNAAVAGAGERLVKQGCEILLLSQISMACAAADMQQLGVPVLNSVDTGVQRVLQLKAGKA